VKRAFDVVTNSTALSLLLLLRVIAEGVPNKAHFSRKQLPFYSNAEWHNQSNSRFPLLVNCFWRIRWEWESLFSFRNGIGLSSTFSFISYHRDIKKNQIAFFLVYNIKSHNPVLGSESLCGNFKREKRDHSLISKVRYTCLRSAYTFTSSIRNLSLDGILIRLSNARARMPWGSPI
jgi:hypothetical protein